MFLPCGLLTLIYEHDTDFPSPNVVHVGEGGMIQEIRPKKKILPAMVKLPTHLPFTRKNVLKNPTIVPDLDRHNDLDGMLPLLLCLDTCPRLSLIDRPLLLK